ncbi:MAG: hypothetical protein JSS71_09770 [Armatimonadetes bacterium]|nr:hypothetical protein [Armatimonadota bacterium]MBX3109446.1 hypothetical protein [Fimbriimonadaceae bacterium]
MAFTPPQSRPYDPRQRPRVGEWVHVPVSGILPQSPRREQPYAAPSQPGVSKPPYVLYAVIAVVALGLVFAVAKLVGGKSMPTPVQVSGGQPEDVPATIKGKPRATVYGKKTEGDILTVLFSYSLGSESRSINRTKPARINYGGCEPLSVDLTADEKIQVRVRLTGDGYVEISKIQLADGTLLDAESQQQTFTYSKPKPVEQKPSGTNGTGAGSGSRRVSATGSTGKTGTVAGTGPTGAAGQSGSTRPPRLPDGKKPPSGSSPSNPNKGDRSGNQHH